MDSEEELERQAREERALQGDETIDPGGALAWILIAALATLAAMIWLLS